MSKNIKALREARGMSQEELAKALNVVVGTVKNWEGEYTKPGQERYVQIAKLFQVPLECVTGLPEDEQFIIDSIRKLGPEFKEALITLIKLKFEEN